VFKFQLLCFFFLTPDTVTPESSTLTPDTLRYGAWSLRFHILHHYIIPIFHYSHDFSWLLFNQSEVLRTWILYFLISNIPTRPCPIPVPCCNSISSLRKAKPRTDSITFARTSPHLSQPTPSTTLRIVSMASFKGVG